LLNIKIRPGVLKIKFPKIIPVGYNPVISPKAIILKTPPPLQEANLQFHLHPREQVQAPNRLIPYLQAVKNAAVNNQRHPGLIETILKDIRTLPNNLPVVKPGVS